jgi:hypothetical protein
MKVILFGATGMVGQGALRECWLAPDVETVLAVGRSATGAQNPKLRELVRPDLFDLAPVETELRGYDACFFCLGVSSAGMREDAYRHLTYDLTLSIAERLARLNPSMAFVTSQAQGRIPRPLDVGPGQRPDRERPPPPPFRAVYLFRPGTSAKRHRLKTPLYRAPLAVMGLLPRGGRSSRVWSAHRQVGRACWRSSASGSAVWRSGTSTPSPRR